MEGGTQNSCPSLSLKKKKAKILGIAMWRQHRGVDSNETIPPPLCPPPGIPVGLTLGDLVIHHSKVQATGTVGSPLFCGLPPVQNARGCVQATLASRTSAAAGKSNCGEVRMDWSWSKLGWGGVMKGEGDN